MSGVHVSMEFVDTKARTVTGTAIHYAFKTINEESEWIRLYCLTGRKSMPIEVSGDETVTCKWCTRLARMKLVLSALAQ